jgi:pimeloyl-ACP methyl ester carboxylesterase
MADNGLHIVGIHGAGFTGHAFDPLVPHLAGLGYGGQFQPVTLPGHATNDTHAPLTSIEAMATWLKALLDNNADRRPVLLAGHSMGALVALAAADHPAVAGLALMGVSLPMPVNADLLQQAKDAHQTAVGLIAKWGCDKNHPQADAVRQTVLNQMAQTPPACLYADLFACNAFAPQALPSKPALIITASQDKMTPAAAGSALAMRLDAKTLTLEGGHMMLVEQAGNIAKGLAGFAQTL